jgi:hypothetical protein
MAIAMLNPRRRYQRSVDTARLSVLAARGGVHVSAPKQTGNRGDRMQVLKYLLVATLF